MTLKDDDLEKLQRELQALLVLEVEILGKLGVCPSCAISGALERVSEGLLDQIDEFPDAVFRNRTGFRALGQGCNKKCCVFFRGRVDPALAQNSPHRRNNLG